MNKLDIIKKQGFVTESQLNWLISLIEKYKETLEIYSICDMASGEIATNALKED